MEVGIEDCLHIEFEYDKARYHLKDSVIGKIYFLLVRAYHWQILTPQLQIVQPQGPLFKLQLRSHTYKGRDEQLISGLVLLQVRIKLKHMEIEIKRKETTGSGSSARSESDTLAKYEIMDGAPVRGEIIPIR